MMHIRGYGVKRRKKMKKGFWLSYFIYSFEFPSSVWSPRKSVSVLFGFFYDVLISFLVGS